MGLVKLNSKEQINDYIKCDLLENRVLIKKAINDKLITDGSVIYVDSNQFLILVTSGIVIDFTMEEGFYTYSSLSEPLMLNDEYGKRLFEYNKNQAIPSNSDVVAYYISTNKIGGNRFGTTNPISYFDNNLGINLDLRFYGVYTIRITNPVLFFYNYKNIIKGKLIYDDKINNEFLNDFISNLALSFDELSKQGVNYELLSDYNKEIAKNMNHILKEKWSIKGINVVDLSIASITLTEESLDKITELQKKLDVNTNFENNGQRLTTKDYNSQIKNSTEKNHILLEDNNIQENNINDNLSTKNTYNNGVINNQEILDNSIINNSNSNNNLNIFSDLSDNTSDYHINNDEQAKIVNMLNNNISYTQKDNYDSNGIINNTWYSSNIKIDNKKIDNINSINELNSQNSSLNTNNINNDLESIDDFVCPNCHAIMDDDYDYCQCCGTKKKGTVNKNEVDITCPVCFYKNVPSSKFCNNCGSKLQ